MTLWLLTIVAGLGLAGIGIVLWHIASLSVEGNLWNYEDEDPEITPWEDEDKEP